MTYKELAEYISNLTEEQINCDVTVYVSGTDEFYSLVGDYPALEAEADDVLDQGHPYLAVDTDINQCYCKRIGQHKGNKMYRIYGDYGYISETLLEQFDSYAEAVQWTDRYTQSGDFGGYSIIEIATFAGDEYTVERRYDADETEWYAGDDDFAVLEDF